MRIIHTSDWHLGKTLEGRSRLAEQALFAEEFVKIVEEHKADMVIIAGDVYDSGQPSAAAETLFYKTVQRLASGGKRPILVIAGNHDAPSRLTAAKSLAYEQGILLAGLPQCHIPMGVFPGFSIIESGEGFVKIVIGEETAVILLLPYPSEKRLQTVISDAVDAEQRQRHYSECIGILFQELAQHYQPNTLNLAVSHLFIQGGQASESERPIQLGGSLAVEATALPASAQYIALGHLHKAQRAPGCKQAYYAGAPLQYSKSEAINVNSVYCVDLKPHVPAKVEKILLTNHKPIKTFICDSITEALQLSQMHRAYPCWAYFSIRTDRILRHSEIKEMKKAMPDIIEIMPMLQAEQEYMQEPFEEHKQLPELFQDYYQYETGLQPSEALMRLFSEIISEEPEHATH